LLFVLAIVGIIVVTFATDKSLFVVIAMTIVVFIVGFAQGSAVVFVFTDGAVFIQVLSLVSFIKLTILKARQFFFIILLAGN